MNNILTLENYNINELSVEQQKSIDGGEPISGAAAIAVLAGVSLGALVVGAAVGYGLYKLVSWATS